MSLAPRIDNLEDPTLMSDIIATKLGHKQYIGGTDVTFSSTPTGWSLIRAIFIPYQMQDGTWRLKFTIVANITGTTGSPQLDLADTVFKNIANYQQPFNASENTASVYGSGRAAPNTGSLIITNNSGASMDQFNCNGDVELESKPTWAL